MDAIDRLRAEIDQIDDALLGLIAQRVSIADALGAAKGLDQSVMRPARETQILRRLISMAPENVDPELVLEVWRALINVNIRRQVAMEVTPASIGEVQRLFDLSRRHFGAMAKINRPEEPRAALTRAVDQPGQCVVLPWPGLGGPGGWWPIMVERRYHPLAIIAALPLRPDDPAAEVEAVVVAANAALEPAGGDTTLAVAFDPYHRCAMAMQKAGIVGREIARARDVIFVQFDDFVAAGDPRLPVVIQAGLDSLRIVGAFSRI